MIKKQKNEKNFQSSILVKLGGVIVAVMVLMSTVMIKTKPVKDVIETSVGNVSDSKTVIIDAGHGGFDGGAVSSDGTVEKNINLKIAQKVADYLRILGFSVIMTREEDDSTESNSNAKIASRKKDDMMNRLSLMNRNRDAICVSIHLNKFTTSIPRGAQVFYGVKNEKSYQLASSIQDSIKNNLQPFNERKIKKGTKSTYLLYNSEIPIVITECGFISNKEELMLLKSDEYQTKMALCIVNGVADYYS